jgi:hypothetical protein
MRLGFLQYSFRPQFLRVALELILDLCNVLSQVRAD